MFDTWNLRTEADFNVSIAPDLFWVPVNSFGKCKYTKEELKTLASSLPYNANKFNNLYETIAGFQLIEFKEKNTNIIKTINETTFVDYDSPEQAILKSYGVCSGIASWLNFFLNRFFDESGYIFIYRSTLSGHVINYFVYNGYYYIINLNVMLKKYKNQIPIEDGDFSMFCKKPFFDGCLLKTKNLKSFVRFYEAYTSIANVDFLFLKIDDYKIPMMNIEYNNNIALLINNIRPYEILNNHLNHKLYKINYCNIQ